jgi:SOS response regulatory protein OraA/RecX
MPADSERAYVVGLKLLAMRELGEAQLRERLSRRHFDANDVDAAVTRLRAERALDDSRTAGAYARTEANLRGRGRFRVLRRLQAMGIAPEVAKAAVGEAFADLDDAECVERALARRLRHGETLENPKIAARMYRYLLAQGFSAQDIGSVLRRHRAAPVDHEL